MKRSVRDGIKAILASSQSLVTAPRDGRVIELLATPDGQRWYGNLGYWDALANDWVPVNSNQPIRPIVIGAGIVEPSRWRGPRIPQPTVEQVAYFRDLADRHRGSPG